MFIDENTFENVVYKMKAIFFSKPNSYISSRIIMMENDVSS